MQGPIAWWRHLYRPGRAERLAVLVSLLAMSALCGGFGLFLAAFNLLATTGGRSVGWVTVASAGIAGR